MRIFLCLFATIQLSFGGAKIGVMETAFGLRCSVKSIRLAKESGYSGVQIHTGRLEKNGQMTISNSTIQKDFLKASKTHGVEISSLCAGAMNRIDVTKPGETREKGRAIMEQSLEACRKLDCQILLFPFFGPSNFQTSDEKLKGVAEFIREILPVARKHKVTIGIESPVTFERVIELFEELGHPKDVQMYYDTGNMGRKNEDINKAIKTLTGDRICEIHLKPKNGIHFGNKDGTDLRKLAGTLNEIGYKGWLVFEQGGGVKKGETGLSKENLKGVKKLVDLRKDSNNLSVPVCDIEVPEDLEVTLWAKSPLLQNPANMDVDVAGRIWVAEAVNYRREIHQPKGDRIVILEDTNGDGQADSSHVFVQDPELISPLGVTVFDNKVVVAQPPHILVYTDVDRDLKFNPKVDKREEFLSGFNARNHDHSLHTIVAGPDGRWYFTQGNCGAKVTDRSGKTFYSGGPYYLNGAGNPEWFTDPTKYAGKKSDDGNTYVGGFAASVNPDGTSMQMVGSGFRNSYEMCVSSLGDMFQNDNDDRLSCRVTWLMEGGDLGYYSKNGHRTWETGRRPGQTTERAHWRQDDPGVVPAGDIYGGGSPTGVALYENGALPKKYEGMLLSCEARARTILSYHPKLSKGGSAMELGNRKILLESKENLNFRPSDIMVGADGALYVCDFYDTKVGGHRAEDPTHSGSIYRIAPKGFTPQLPKLSGDKLRDAVMHLQSPAASVRHVGFETLKAAGAKALPLLRGVLESDNEWIRARGVWLLPYLGENGLEQCRQYLQDKHPQNQLLGFRALRAAGHDVLEMAAQLSKSPYPAVRREVALSLRDMDAKKKLPLVVELFRTVDGKDRHYLEACGLAAEDIEKEVWKAINDLEDSAPMKWSMKHVWATWRLHPKAAVAALVERVKSQNLSFGERDFAMTTLAFCETKEAVAAIIDMAGTGGKLAKGATAWLITKGLDEWGHLGVRKALKERGIYDPKTIKIQPISIPPAPKTKLPPANELANKNGDPIKGKAQAARCFMCHQIEGQGVNYGPELKDWVANQGKEAFFDAVIHPTKDLAHGFTGRRIKLKNGDVVEGLLFSNSDPVVVQSTGGVEQMIPKDRIESMKAMWKQSLMLSADQLGFTAEQLVDLAAYLETYQSKSNPSGQ